MSNQQVIRNAATALNDLVTAEAHADKVRVLTTRIYALADVALHWAPVAELCTADAETRQRPLLELSDSTMVQVRSSLLWLSDQTNKCAENWHMDSIMADEWLAESDDDASWNPSARAQKEAKKAEYVRDEAVARWELYGLAHTMTNDLLKAVALYSMMKEKCK